jgi:hypothetical protein
VLVIALVEGFFIRSSLQMLAGIVTEAGVFHARKPVTGRGGKPHAGG